MSTDTPRCTAKFLYYIIFGAELGGGIFEMSFKRECTIQYHAKVFGVVIMF